MLSIWHFLSRFEPLYILEQENFNLPDIEGISKMYFVYILSLNKSLHENIAKIIMYIRTWG